MTQFNKKTLIFFTAIVLAGFFGPLVFATPPASFYNSGETLNPNCSPTDVNCDVEPPLTSANINDTVFGPSWNGDTTHAPSKNAVYDEFNTKQDALVSGTNIKTINSISLLGSGDIAISGITNGAGANAIPKSDGTNLVASLIYDDGTNVGIGTVSPGYLLDVNGLSNFSDTMFLTKAGIGTGFRLNSGSDPSGIFGGIGTGNIGAIIDTGANDNLRHYGILNSVISAGNGDQIGVFSGAYGGGSGTRYAFFADGDGSGSEYNFYGNNSNGILYNAGNVGIGVLVPTAALDVSGAGNFSSTVAAAGFFGPLTGNVTGNVSGNAGTVTNGVYTTGAGTVFLAPNGSAAALTSFPTLNQNTTGNAATVTTNANLTGPITSVGNATSVASQTGTGTTFVMQNAPTLVTPVLGAATATSINGLAITSSTGTLSITNGKTLSASNTLTLAGTDGSTLNIGSGGTLGTNAYTSTAYLPLTGGTLTGNLLFTDNTYDIGASGATRPRNIYAAGTGTFSSLLSGSQVNNSFLVRTGTGSSDVGWVWETGGILAAAKGDNSTWADVVVRNLDAATGGGNIATGGQIYFSAGGFATFRSKLVSVSNDEIHTSDHTGSFYGSFGSANLQIYGTSTTTKDTGLSRISAGVIGIGNGTDGDFSGSLKAAGITLTGSIIGSGSANRIGTLTTAYSKADTALSPSAAGQTPLLIQTKSSGSEPAFLVQKSTGANIISIGSNTEGGGYTPTSVADIRIGINGNGILGDGLALVETTTGNARTLSWGINNTAAFQMAYGVKAYAFDNGSFLKLPAAASFSWSSTSDPTVSADAGISRDSAGVIDVGNGTAGNTSGTLKAAAFKAGTPTTTYAAADSILAPSATGKTPLVIESVASGTEPSLVFIDSTGGRFANIGAQAQGGAYTPTKAADVRIGITGTGAQGEGLSLQETTTGSGRTLSWGINNTAAFQMAYNVKVYAFDSGTFLKLPTAASFSWSSTSDPTVSADTGISRDSAGVIDVGNGTAGNTSGTIKAAIHTTGAGVAGTFSSTAPAVAATSTAGTATSLLASDAVAGNVTAGAAAGGAVTITGGNAARLTSGNAIGGNIILTGGTAIGTGTAGQVQITNIGTAGAPALVIGASGGLQQNGFLSINSGGGLQYANGGTAKMQFDSSVRLTSSGEFSFNSSSTDPSGADVRLSRGGVATLQLGAANAASPVAQILQAQGSRGGTDADVAGGSLTIRSGNGTGTGGSGSLIFQTAPAGSTGSTANTMTTALTIANTGIATFAFSPTSPGAGAGSERYGAAAIATGAGTTVMGSAVNAGSNTSGVAIGDTAALTGTLAVAIGHGSTAGAGGVSIGNSTTGNGSAQAIVIGNSANVSSNGGIAIGQSATMTNGSTVVIGTGASVSASGAMAFGSNANASQANSIALGVGALGDTANMFALGSNGNPINSIRFGSSDVSLSRTASATLAIGNGTAGDASGTMKGKQFIGQEVNNKNFVTTGTTSANGGWAWQTGNILAAENGDNSAYVDVKGKSFDSSVGGGNIATSAQLFFGGLTTYSAKFTVAADTIRSIDSSGNFYGNHGVGVLQVFGRTNTTLDTGISRVSAGVLGVGNGTDGDFTGSLKAAGITLTGTASLADTAISDATPTLSNAGFATCTSLTTVSNVVTCTVSDRTVKTNFHDFAGGDGLAFIRNIQPQTYSFKEGTPYFDNNRERLGLIAQEVDAAGLHDAVLPIGNGLSQIDFNAVTAATIAAVKELDLNLEGIAGTITPLPGSASESFVAAFFGNMKTKIGAWLADATNGITDIFAKKINTNTLCISDDTGAKTCITKSQLDALLSGSAGSSPSSTPTAASTSSGSLTPPTTTTDDSSTSPSATSSESAATLDTTSVTPDSATSTAPDTSGATADSASSPAS